jgi:hypothetical protein
VSRVSQILESERQVGGVPEPRAVIPEGAGREVISIIEYVKVIPDCSKRRLHPFIRHLDNKPLVSGHSPIFKSLLSQNDIRWMYGTAIRLQEDQGGMKRL